MAISNTKLGGTDWSDGDVLEAADLNDTFDAAVDSTLNREMTLMAGVDGTGASLASSGVMRFSASIWVGLHHDGDGYRTTDSGANWSADSDINSYRVGAVCAADGTKGFAAKSDGTVKYTTDSGANWSSPSTAPPNISAAYVGSFPTAAVAVLGGDASSGDGVWKSTDGGDNWAQGTGLTDGKAVNALHMLDATHGVLIDEDANIFKTTDGGATWTDTTTNMPNSGDGGYLVCTSRSTDDITYFAVMGGAHNGGDNQVFFAQGDTTAAPSVVGVIGTTTDNAAGGVVEANNGNFYAFTAANNTTTRHPGQLWVSEDSGVTWLLAATLPTMNIGATAINCTTSIWEGANNIIYVSQGGLLFVKCDRTLDQ